MSSLIEKAAQRLEQLKRAGADVPEVADIGAVVPSASGAPVAFKAPPVSAPPALAVSSRMVELDLEALSAAGIVTPHAQRTVTADQFRVIKRPLLANATGKGAVPVRHGNRIMVTSALPGEGKTFTAINLAMSIAMELDHTVLLVDADVSRPSVMKTLGLPSGPGLLDLLMGEKLEMSDALLRTSVDKLALLPSGTPHPRATELLASDAMTALVEEMGRRYPERIIVFDSPPLLMTTESRVLASHMGQIVVVVQAGHTQRSQVRQALETIESCPIKLMVLNQIRGVDKSTYGYGYGYDDSVKAEAQAT
ncbi:MAG: XrtA-associated tyrosine autokinase [Hydrogenophaga sp.]|uniref:XrtA-associated tyrosine autokinase n=1 Tax=Hydrogenophaga sp. TaxID=1904254 RepID=UPI001D92B814|nr:XrtA-associated tyrosine autokinase [Hydrogenophaga sp.]MBX3610163.1 XrtA-associated tyrosine autokinase [Hydrogenophaga sp.]